MRRSMIIAALLLGPGIPLALLYLTKWWASKIPDTPLIAMWSLVSTWLRSTLRSTGRFTGNVETVLGAGRTGAVSETK